MMESAKETQLKKFDAAIGAVSAKDVRVKGSAPGQYLGFALQPVRLFYHLLKCDPEDQVGLEHVDDVSVHTNHGVRVAEQCKSALSRNPVSNWAVESSTQSSRAWLPNRMIFRMRPARRVGEEEALTASPNSSCRMVRMRSSSRCLRAGRWARLDRMSIRGLFIAPSYTG